MANKLTSLQECLRPVGREFAASFNVNYKPFNYLNLTEVQFNKIMNHRLPIGRTDNIAKVTEI